MSHVVSYTAIAAARHHRNISKTCAVTCCYILTWFDDMTVETTNKIMVYSKLETLDKFTICVILRMLLSSPPAPAALPAPRKWMQCLTHSLFLQCRKLVPHFTKFTCSTFNTKMLQYIFMLVV